MEDGVWKYMYYIAVIHWNELSLVYCAAVLGVSTTVQFTVRSGDGHTKIRWLGSTSHCTPVESVVDPS
jgi:hypothetical protein